MRALPDGIVIHTGQHYHRNLSALLLRQLSLHVDVNLSATTLPAMIDGVTQQIRTYRPAAVIVYGDVNSTLAGALAAKICGVRLIHVESGLRSSDLEMPEEVNRITIDHLAQELFAPSADAVENLSFEGLRSGVHLVGNVMADTLLRLLPPGPVPAHRRFALLTLHRPSNVDDDQRFRAIMAAVARIPITFKYPAHPRTGWSPDLPVNVAPLSPVGYLQCLNMQRTAQFVVTDSGGIQEETSILNVPCLTVRADTERPVTITMGTNTLVTPETLPTEAMKILAGQGKHGTRIPLWDGHAAERIAAILIE